MRRLVSSICLFFFTFFLVFAAYSGAEQKRYPGKTWDKIEQPEELGYSSKKLAQARAFSESLKTAAVVIVVDGIILDEWGSVGTKYVTHSIRKSFMSALYGNYVKEGIIDLDKSMHDLGIDDKPPLSEEEKKTTIRDCLKARSGIYHLAQYETLGMKALRPKRYSHAPGTFWYYNNWDFNVLCTIFENLTGKKFFEALEEDICRPIQMEHFTADDGWYGYGEFSIHPAYTFLITARDMARFGLLMLRKGNWNGEQVIPEEWVEESTSYYSNAMLYSRDGYGYMWWVVHRGNLYPHLPHVRLENGAYSAWGSGGHHMFVIPDKDMVVVHRVNTFIRGNRVTNAEMGRLLQMILDAKMNN